MKELDKLWDTLDEITPENLEEFKASLDKEEIINMEVKARELTDCFILGTYSNVLLAEKMLIYGQLLARVRKV